jgi:hypothetical protein
LAGYGGGFLYETYIFMTDITGIAIIVFSLTGIFLGVYSSKNLFPKLLLLFIGLVYTLLVIITFMRA